MVLIFRHTLFNWRGFLSCSASRERRSLLICRSDDRFNAKGVFRMPRPRWCLELVFSDNVIIKPFSPSG
ncbi:hypothetical protein M378DRAFT_212613 [Amanita muscaria Koide BX008]|uniref:Uncharacterized protein n=1 Tax=Amanita muscaria (strain Koide BX008) TaxID=946122 RepID=A0A0C2XQ58_AMAMK|nr:hypothetical protein M378DRAFT_212613 [Amanita muscaria Koide BX008]